MTRYWFDQLMTHLHFAHVKEGASLLKDKTWKLYLVIESLNNSFWSTFMPGEDIIIDKSIGKFHGQLAFKTYNPTKRFGLKAYRFCASIGSATG